MANAQDVGFFGPNNPSIQAQQRQIKQQQALADALTKAGSEQSQTEFAGGLAVPQSPVVGVSKLAEMLSGAYLDKKNQEASNKLSSDSYDQQSKLFGKPDVSPQQYAASLSPDDPTKKFMTDNPLPPVQTNAPMQMPGIDWQTSMAMQSQDPTGYAKALMDSKHPKYEITKDAGDNPVAINPYDPTTAIPVAGTIGTKPKTESQSNASLFAARMMDAEPILEKLGDQGTHWGRETIANLPGGNYLVPTEYQQFDQAKRNFLNAVLRKESGAAISSGEFDSGGKQYFPQPGDSPEVLQQKEQNRKTAISQLNIAANNKPAPAAIPDGSAPSAQPVAHVAPPPNTRVAGRIYPTPKGNMTWTGTGWLPAN